MPTDKHGCVLNEYLRQSPVAISLDDCGYRTVANEAYACAIYEDRPRTFRALDRASANCMDSPRQLGLAYKIQP